MNPESLIPPDPSKIGEYIGLIFELSLDFSADLTNLIVAFIGSIGRFVV